MKIPSEAELIEMEHRTRGAISRCVQIARSPMRINQDDVLDILESLESILEDQKGLISVIRDHVWTVRYPKDYERAS
jgi:hypothetical protein